MKPMLIAIHRWLGIGLAAFWLLQALTGVALVFHWELDDWLLDGDGASLDTRALDRRLDLIAADYPDTSPRQVWTSAGLPGRYDIHLEGPADAPEIIRVSGSGDILRERTANDKLGNGGIYPQLVIFHQSLLAGTPGEWIVGLSGVMLVSTLAMGLAVAWPRRRTWKRTLFSLRLRSPSLAWHRTLGLWLATPALALTLTGVGLSFSGGLASVLGIEPLSAESAGGVPDSRITPGTAIERALAAHPTSVFAGLIMPAPERDYYTVRLRSPGEWRRAYGKTTVLVSPYDGTILGQRVATNASLAERILNRIFPVHTGEVLGLPGRILSLGIGIWIIAMVVLGLISWRKRQQRLQQRSK